jgi:hypothetical protein
MLSDPNLIYIAGYIFLISIIIYLIIIKKNSTTSEIDIIAHARIEELEYINGQIQKSIDFAAIIQETFYCKKVELDEFFEDSFVILNQRDKVGGDIILFEKINPNECLIMLIDCTNHGVSGAFVSMIVKTLQRQIIKELKSLKVISPSTIMQRFNYEIKYILDQYDIRSKSNVGFDGQILYYNKNKKIIKFSSARNNILLDTKGEFLRIKGDTESVGYKDSNINYVFTEHEYKLEMDTQLYMYSDGIIGQQGGEKNLPFGHKRTIALIDENKSKSMKDQKISILNSIEEYKGELSQNDDISFLGLKIKV